MGGGARQKIVYAGIYYLIDHKKYLSVYAGMSKYYICKKLIIIVT